MGDRIDITCKLIPGDTYALNSSIYSGEYKDYIYVGPVKNEYLDHDVTFLFRKIEVDKGYPYLGFRWRARTWHDGTTNIELTLSHVGYSLKELKPVHAQAYPNEWKFLDSSSEAIYYDIK